MPIWVRHPDYVILPAGIAWRTDSADAAALRASYNRTVAAVGRDPLIQPIPSHLLSARWLLVTGAAFAATRPVISGTYTAQAAKDTLIVLFFRGSGPVPDSELS